MELILKKIFILCLMAFSIVEATKHCKNIVEFDGKTYEKEFLIDGLVSKPFFMAYIKNSNKILFNTDAEPFGTTETLLFDLTSKDLNNVATVKNAVASVVGDNGLIYIAQEGGLYTFDEKTKEVAPTNLKDVNFYSMLYNKGKLYYTDFPNRDLYFYKDEQPQIVIKGLNINDFTFDSNDNFYYFNKTGPYFQRKDSDKIHDLSALAYEEVPLLGLIYDERKNEVYATSVYGIFKYDIEKMELNRISMKTMYDIIFDDENNMIYSDEENIVRLKPTEMTC